MDEDLKRNPTPNSPSVERRRVEHVMEIEDLEAENQLTCCLSRNPTDKRILVFVSQSIISFSVLTFSFIELSKGTDNESFYTGIIGTIMGIYLPSPTLNSKKK